MRIAVTTIQNSSNYGAMLQAFALQSFIQSTGHIVEIINYDNRYMSKGLNKIRHGKSLLEVYYILLDILNYSDRKKMIYNFKLFSNKYLRLGRLKSKEEILSDFNTQYDVFISGSDQIWNPKVTNGIVDPVYFCGMARSGEKVISYASSVGGYDFKDKQQNLLIKKYLNKYHAISTRENSYKKILEELTGKHIIQVMDPVFLINAKEWKECLCIENDIGRPYILIYAMSKHEKIIDRVLSEYSGSKFDVVIIYAPLIRRKRIKYVVDAGPREFVELFANAEKIITNSFHGTAFGLIFNKKLSVLNNAHNMNRIYDLLTNVGAEKLLINESDLLAVEKDIDYVQINKRLAKLIEVSKAFLEKELTDVIK